MRKSPEELIEGYLNNNLTSEELSLFIQLLKEDRIEPPLREYVDRLFAASAAARPALDEAGRDAVFREILEAPVIPMRRKVHIYRRAGVAAAVVCLLAAGSWLFWKKAPEKPVVSIAQVAKEPVRPSTKATLKLGDGTVVALDDAKNGELARQGGSQVVKIDGKLAYNSSAAGDKEVLYNTISTPRGGQYQVELADGTKVWLNAASSLHFPTAFRGKERSIEITGEAYLEVAKNKDQPFVVVVNGSRVEVLGTSFNISAYEDDKQLTTTLLEGSVKFVNGMSETLLAPGQQSRLFNGRVRRVDNVDVNAVVAWKNGMFHFENATIEAIMNQLSRWYDVEVVYEEVGQKFQNKRMGDMLHADIPRDTKLNDVLKALEIACKEKFQLENKKIIIKH